MPQAKLLQHERSSINKLRQERAHAHAVVVDEIFNNIIITDLGIDKVMVYHIDVFNGALEVKFKQEVSVPLGSGPRHIAVHAETKYVYVLNELTGTVTVMRYYNGHLEPLSTDPALPKEFKAIPSAAAIRITGDGKFIYTSERGDDCISDSITIFKVDKKNGMIEIAYLVENIKSPVCLEWLQDK